MRRALALINCAVYLGIVLLSFAGPSLAEEGTNPVKIKVEPVVNHVEVGQQVEIEIKLHNAMNGLANAPKMLPVTLEFTSPSGVTNQTEIFFKPDQSSTRIRLPITERGVFFIHVNQPELLDDDAYVLGVRPAPGYSSSLETWGRANEPAVSALPRIVAERTAESTRTMRLPSTGRATYRDSSPPIAAAMASGGARLQLFHRPRRRLLADGIDKGTIQAFLVGETARAEQNIEIYLFNTQGKLLPIPLVIQEDDVSGIAELTADQVGDVTVSYVKSLPTVEVLAPTQVHFSFRPPITGYSLRASPPTISLLDPSEVVFELLNSVGTPIATDEDRRVSLLIAEGHGAVDPADLVVPAGQSNKRATFIPTLPGTVIISASTPNLLSTSSATIEVSWPWLLIVISLAGGLVGGWVKYYSEKQRSGIIVVGAVGGVLLFWGSTIGLLDEFPRALALNPFSAFAVSVAGGWAGTKVLDSLMKKFGLAG